MKRPNRVVFVLLVLLGLLIAALIFSSCGPKLTKQQRQELRDSKLLKKIEQRSPRLLQTKVDSVFENEDIPDINMEIPSDTMAFDSLLEKYYDLRQANEEMASRNLNLEHSIHDRRFLATKLRETIQDLRKGSMKDLDTVIRDKEGWVTIPFKYEAKTGKFSIEGAQVKKMTITNNKTVRIVERIQSTTWQAVKKMWWLILLLVLIIVITKIIR